jgi:hypothetical protein
MAILGFRALKNTLFGATLLMCFSLQHLAAAETLKAHNDSVQTLMEVTGTNRSLLSFSQQVGFGFIDGLSAIEKIDSKQVNLIALKQALASQIDIQFEVGVLQKHVAFSLGEKLSSNDINTVTDFYASELGRRIDSFYQQNHTDEQHDALVAKIRTTNTSELDTKRLMMAESIVSSTSTHVLVSTLIIEAMVAPLLGIRDALPKRIADDWNQQADIAGLIRHIESMRPMLEQQTLDYLTLVDYLTLEELSNDEYQRYATLSKTRAGNAFYNTLAHALMGFSRNSFYTLGEESAHVSLLTPR